MPQNIINTVFPSTQGFDSVPVEKRPPFSPGEGSGNIVHPAGVEANQQTPGVGVPVEVPSLNSRK